MKCDEARPLLDAYVDAELPAAEREALREHIASCAECGPEAAAIERLREEIRRSVPFYRAPPFCARGSVRRCAARRRVCR